MILPTTHLTRNLTRPFLTASWQDLLLLNWRVDPRLLQHYLPEGTELDSFCGDDFDLSGPPKTAPNPFSVSSVRFGRVSDMRENYSVAVEPEPQGVQVVEWVGLVASGLQF